MTLEQKLIREKKIRTAIRNVKDEQKKARAAQHAKIRERIEHERLLKEWGVGL